MAKYLVEASYTAEGLKGLQKEKASGRKAAVAEALKGLGGKLEVAPGRSRALIWRNKSSFVRSDR